MATVTTKNKSWVQKTPGVCGGDACIRNTRITVRGLAELYAGASKHSQSNRLLTLIGDLLQEVQVVDFDARCAEKFGQVRGTLSQQGIAVPTTDLMIASAALIHNRTLVTPNTADFQQIPGLRLEDWLIP